MIRRCTDFTVDYTTHLLSNFAARDSLMKKIAIFNHKGGVSKSTTTFNLGWALAEAGKRVLLVDCDPQCNLTGMVLALEGLDDLGDFYEAHPNSNLYAAARRAFEGSPEKIEAAEIVTTTQPNLFLLPGHIDTGLFEPDLAMAHKLLGAMSILQNLPGALGYLLDETAKANKIDYVFLDMSPSVGALNQNLLVSCDYFIVPVAPDYFSYLAIDSLSKTLPRWAANANELRARSGSLIYKLPNSNPKFLGIVSQRFNVRSGKVTNAYQKWIDKIVDRCQESLIPSLQEAGMLLPENDYDKALGEGWEIAQVPDFHGLIGKSQEHSKAVFALTDEELDMSGRVEKTYIASRNKFKEIFKSFSEKVIELAK